MTDTAPALRPLPLFPLRAVLFPGGLLSLKVFEARYLDLVSTCLREQRGFGVVGLRKGGEVRMGAGEPVEFETIGCEAELIEVNGDQPGILQVRARGTERFQVHSYRQEADGLWHAQVSEQPADDALAPPAEMHGSVRSLMQAVASLQGQGIAPFLEPHRYDDAGWVANRWCELLPLSQEARQRLMELPDALVRLQLVDTFLRSKGVVG